MINLEKIKYKKCQPPILRRPAPATFFYPLFLIFQIHSPPPGEVIKTYFLPFLKPSDFLLDQFDYKKKSLLSCQFFQFIHPCLAYNKRLAI